MQNCLVVVLSCAAVLVGLDCTNVRGLGAGQVLDESTSGSLYYVRNYMYSIQLKAHLDSVASRWRPLLAIGIRTVREEALQEGIATGPNQVVDVLDESIFVLVRHARDIVRDISGVVLDHELIATRLEVRV